MRWDGLILPLSLARVRRGCHDVGTWVMQRVATVLHDTLCDLADTWSRLACYRAWTLRGLAALGGPAGETLYRSSKPRAAMIRLARSTVTPW